MDEVKSYVKAFSYKAPPKKVEKQKKHEIVSEEKSQKVSLFKWFSKK